MPTLTRWFVKTSLIYLVLSLITGLLIAAQPLLGQTLPSIYPVYLHLLTIGWISLLIFGVVFWMFPKYSREQPHHSDRLGWSVYITINLGLILRAISEPMTTIQPGGPWGWVLTLAAILLWISGVLFVINTWGRVKER